MTPLRSPAAATRPGPITDGVVMLADAHREALLQLLDADPLTNAMAVARVKSSRSLMPERLGAAPLGVGNSTHLAAAALYGGNLVPIGTNAAAFRLLGDHLVASGARHCTSIVGPAAAVHQLWERLSPGWGPAREVRGRQPLLALRDARGLAADPRVRPLGLDELDRYLPAATAMFTEELGISPLASPGAAGFRRRATQLLGTGRVLGMVDDAGDVFFKADIGALTPATCQIQGVWVRPDLRGRGVGTVAMAAVLRHALSLAPTVSLYVNDFNEPARRLYAGLGMQQVGELATVLF